ncbi:hypothetical protein B0H14DRAFT_2498516 [Mycena olivaceomarginata]|nr:hypothetical protein B0H14DRAFT_2498516 [Mycena olivaceomarginata]
MGPSIGQKRRANPGKPRQSLFNFLRAKSKFYAGQPEGYIAKRLSIQERDPSASNEGLDGEKLLLFTTQPPVTMTATLAEYPEGWTECLLHADVKALVVGTPGFPRSLAHPATLNYRIGPSESKGQGMFSTRKLDAGDLVLVERPLTVSPSAMSIEVHFPTDFTAEQKMQAYLHECEKMWRFLFERMHPDNQSAFMALANSHKQDGTGPIGGIIRTNALGIDCFQTERTRKYGGEHAAKRSAYGAVCKEISRVNHSCIPNTTAHFDITSFSFQLFAVRDIEADEELTISYVATTDTTKERQTNLESYGFQCSCAACLAPSESDATRA